MATPPADNHLPDEFMVSLPGGRPINAYTDAHGSVVTRHGSAVLLPAGRHDPSKMCSSRKPFSSFGRASAASTITRFVGSPQQRTRTARGFRCLFLVGAVVSGLAATRPPVAWVAHFVPESRGRRRCYPLAISMIGGRRTCAYCLDG
jgi:hypothetical protein